MVCRVLYIVATLWNKLLIMRHHVAERGSCVAKCCWSEYVYVAASCHGTCWLSECLTLQTCVSSCWESECVKQLNSITTCVTHCQIGSFHVVDRCVVKHDMLQIRRSYIAQWCGLWMRGCDDESQNGVLLCVTCCRQGVHCCGMECSVQGIEVVDVSSWRRVLCVLWFNFNVTTV